MHCSVIEHGKASLSFQTTEERSEAEFFVQSENERGLWLN